MATIEGARALGLESLIGSIEVGKSADLIAIDTATPSMRPLHDMHAQLIHTDAARHVTHCWIAGQCLLADGKHTRVDVHRALAQADSWKERLSA